MSDSICLDLGNQTVTVTVKRSASARRISLRIDPAHGPLLILPPEADFEAGRQFTLANRRWLRDRLAVMPEIVTLAAGVEVPLLGVPHPIRHVPDGRRGAWVEDGALMVCGLPEHVGRRAADFLKAEAKRQIVPRTHLQAELLGCKPGRISLKDTRSRWGSCTPKGDLSFSWRLVLAPEQVLDYVIAHEVAHLVEMNHSAAFWSVVRTLVGDIHTPRQWLHAHGPGLHRFRAAAG